MDWTYYFNTDKYTVLQLSLICVGGLMWVALYLIMIFRARKSKYIEMPYFVACGNIAWEFLWSWVLNDRIDLGEFYIIVYRAWFVLDCVIFYHLLKYGRKQCHNPHIKRFFIPICLSLVLMWTGLIYSFAVSDFDQPLGVNSAYILNLGISILYITLFMHQHESGEFLKSVAWLKMLGSGLITIAFWRMIPETHHFEHYAGPMVFVVDCIYLYILYTWKHPQLDDAF